MVSSWIEKTPGLNEYTDVLVLPNSSIEVKSSVGEWIIGSRFSEKEYMDLWRKAGLSFDSRLAIFRSTPCEIGNYTWNYEDYNFNVTYNNRLVTWIYRHD